jgi:predicted transcriptional regulator
MSAHEAITAHTKKMNAHLEAFVQMDAQREQAIDEALALCQAGEPFNTDEINRITNRINKHAAQGISPTRPLVTEEMVREYAAKLASR